MISQNTKFFSVLELRYRKVDYAHFWHGSMAEERLFLLLEHYEAVVH